jgi:hypothetical protein
MRIENLIENNNLSSNFDVIENTSRRSIFESIGQGDIYFARWEKEIHPILCEVALTPDQIQQLFTTIEKGSDRTLLGKVKDAPGKISDAWFNKFGGMLQSSTPVKAFDQKFEEIKSSIAAKNPKLAASLAKYGEYAKNNPKLHKFLLGIAGSVAAALGVAVAGGIGASVLAIGTGTAIAVGIVNIADRLLQGQKASTAIGRGATAGIVAGISAAAMAGIGKWAAGLREKSIEIADGLEKISFKATRELRLGGMEMKEMTQGFDVVVDADAASAIRAAVNGIQNGDTSAFGQLQDLGRLVHSADYKARMKDVAGFAKEMAFNNDSLLQWIKGLTQAATAVGGAAAGQAAGAAGEKAATPAPKEGFTATGKKLSEGQIYMIFNRVCTHQQLDEGPIWDKVKGAASNAWQREKEFATKGMDKLKTVGKNLTTKFTADKLNSAWQKAGSPTDSEEVAKVLTAAGVGDDVVKKVYTDLKISAAPEAQAATGGYAEVKKAIAQLNTKDRKRMIAYLTKQLGTA